MGFCQIKKKIFYKFYAIYSEKKFIVNKVIGLAGKKYGSKQKTKIFRDYDESEYFRKNSKNPSRIVVINEHDNNKDEVFENNIKEDLSNQIQLISKKYDKKIKSLTHTIL